MTGILIYLIIGVSLYFLLEDSILENMRQRNVEDTEKGRLINVIIVGLLWLPIIIHAIVTRNRR